MWIQLVNSWEALPIFPKELHQSQLGEDSDHIGGTLFCDQHSVNSAAKDFYRLGQVCCMGKRNQRLLLATNLLNISQRDRLPLASLLCELVE